jgi:hypothetical protein
VQDYNKGGKPKGILFLGKYAVLGEVATRHQLELGVHFYFVGAHDVDFMLMT